MKTLNLALIFCLFIIGIYGANIQWNNTFTVGDWSTGSNWVGNQVPGSGDVATLAASVTVSVSQNVNVDQLVTAGNSKITVINNSTFNINNNVTQSGAFTIQTEAGSSFNSVNYFIFDGSALNCFNFGSITFVPRVNAAVVAGTLSNSATGNNVVFSGNKPIIIDQNFNVPSGFVFANSAQTFTSTGNGAAVIFSSSTSVSNAGWTFVNDGDVISPVQVQFLGGATLGGNIVASNTSVVRARPTVTFAGSFTLTQNVNLNVVPTFGAGIVAFNGAGLTATFNILSQVSIGSSNIQGDAILLFQNQLPDSAPTTVSFTSPVSVDSPGFNFTGNWIFSGSDVTFTTARNLNFNLTLSNNLIFAKPSSFAANALLSNNGGSVTFTDAFSSSNQYTFNGFNPTLACTVANNKQFSITGSSLNFINGLTVNGCTISSSATLTITGSLATVNGNTTLPATNVVINGTAFTFSSPSTPSNSLYSITLLSTLTVPLNTTYTASAVEVILPSSGVLNLGDNAVLANAADGLFSLNGGITFSSGNTINSLTAFPSGNSAITTTARVTWNGNILLRNTVLGGNGDVWFFGSIVSLKGISTITNPNFRFKSGVSLVYLWDGALPNSGSQLVINTNGNTGSRIIEGNVQASQSTNIVFDDNININTTATVSGSGSPLGAVTFRTNGQTQASLTTTGVVTLNRNIFFNHTNFHLTGLGSFLFGSNPSIYLSGGLNFPNAANDAIVTANNDLYIGVVVNSTIGSTVNINAGLTTDDLDNIATTASTKLTLFSESTLSRKISGPLVLGSSLTFGGNVIVADATTVNSVGTIEILGTSLTLQSSATWSNRVVISQAFTVNSQGANTLTLQDQNPAHGFTIPSTFTVNGPATVVFSGLYSLAFQSASTLSGNGVVSIQNTIVTGTAAVTISPQTLTLNNVTLVGSGSYNIQPVDQNLNIGTFVRAFVSTVYNGNTLNVQSATTISPLFTFTSNPLTINGNTLTISTGSYTVNSRWIVNTAIIFQGATTIATTGSFASTGALTFNNSLILTQNTAISNPITFGSNRNYIVTVSNGGFVLTLNGTSVTVNSIVVSAGGSIVSVSPNPPSVYQVISGSNGIINSDWTWSNSVQFGSLNITGARTLTFNLALTNNVVTYFTDGVTFNGGTFVQTQTGTSPTLEVEKSITTNVATTVGPAITVNVAGSIFNFLGTSVLTLNGTFTSNSAIVFNQNVIFGYNNVPTSSNAITLAAGSSSWSPASASIQIWRTSITVPNGVNTNINIQPSLIFGASSFTFTVGSGSSVSLNGNLNVFGTAFTGTGNLVLGPITITSQQNNTLSGFTLSGALTLNSTTSPWVEPVFSPTGNIVQSITLNGPARLASPTFGPQAQINGPARVAITDSLIINSAFTFNSPVQLYVSQPQGSFTFNLANAQSYLTFSSTPSLFNPLGYNINTNTNFILTSSNTYNILKFSVTSPLIIGDLTINGGTLQLTSGTTTAGVVNVAGTATLWVDGNALTSSAVVFSQNTDGTSPSYYQLTVSSNNPPAITTGSVVYKGAASIVVNNFNWDGTAVTGITATSSNGASNNFLSVTGTPGYTYTSTRNGNNVQFSRTSSPTVSPSPTQSNGPSPAVSASTSISMNMILFFVIFVIYFIF